MLRNIIAVNIGAIIGGSITLWLSFNPVMLAWVAANVGACIVALISTYCYKQGENHRRVR